MENNGVDEHRDNTETESDINTYNTTPEKDTTVSIPVRASLKIWVTISVCLTCYVISLYGMVVISTQYFTKRIAKDKYNFDYKDENNCGNASNSSSNNLIDKVQTDVAALNLGFIITTGIPSLFVSLLVGSYSDFIGRKPLLLASTIGGFIKVSVLCLIVGFEGNLKFFYIGAFLDGCVGSSFTTILAITSIIADITVPQERAFKFAIIECILLVVVAISQVGIGVLITSIGYLPPCLAIAALFLIVIVLIVAFCPETSQKKSHIVRNPLVHMRRVFGFYIYNDPKNKRPLYLIGIAMFCFGSATMGRNNVELLYMTSDPLCWDALTVGVFTAIKLVAMAVAALVFLKVAQKCLSIEITGFICAFSACLGFVSEGFADTTGGMLISALIGILYLSIMPIPRALLSQLTSPEEQGALFSSISIVDVLTGMIANTLFTGIYNSTLDSFKGAVFMAVGALCLFNGTFMILFRIVRRGKNLYSDPITSDISNEDTFIANPSHESESEPLIVPT